MKLHIYYDYILLGGMQPNPVTASALACLAWQSLVNCKTMFHQLTHLCNMYDLWHVRYGSWHIPRNMTWHGMAGFTLYRAYILYIIYSRIVPGLFDRASFDASNLTRKSVENFKWENVKNKYLQYYRYRLRLKQGQGSLSNEGGVQCTMKKIWFII